MDCLSCSHLLVDLHLLYGLYCLFEIWNKKNIEASRRQHYHVFINRFIVIYRIFFIQQLYKLGLIEVLCIQRHNISILPIIFRHAGRSVRWPDFLLCAKCQRTHKETGQTCPSNKYFLLAIISEAINVLLRTHNIYCTVFPIFSLLWNTHAFRIFAP